jgi:multiple sugar transport system permease protein
MIAPNLGMFSLFIVIPIVAGLYLSFTTWDINNGAPKWVGLANYTKMFNDPIVGVAVGNTVKFMLFGVVPTVFIALGLAMLINVRFRFVGVVRSLYLIPAAMSFAASAIVWRYIFLDGPGYGVVNWVLSQLGVDPPNWLVSTTWALPALDVIAVWLSLPVATILYLAALQRIPASVIEAATLDGAGPIRRVRYIIWPMVRPMTILVAIVALLSFTNGSFDLVNILTPTGGTNYATTTVIFYIYQQAFAYGLYGYAAALAVLQIALISGALLALRGFYLLGNRRR